MKNLSLSRKLPTLALMSTLAATLSAAHSRVNTEIPSCLRLTREELHQVQPGFRCMTSQGVEFQKAPFSPDSIAFAQDAWIDRRTGRVWGERMGRVVQREVKLGGALLKRRQVITSSDAVAQCEEDALPAKVPTIEIFMDAMVRSGLGEVLPAIRTNPNLQEYYTTVSPVRRTLSAVWAVDVTLSSTGNRVHSFRAAQTVRDVSLNELICYREADESESSER
jgi:hypothetical protein